MHITWGHRGCRRPKQTQPVTSSFIIIPHCHARRHHAPHRCQPIVVVIMILIVAILVVIMLLVVIMILIVAILFSLCHHDPRDCCHHPRHPMVGGQWI